MSTDLCTGLIKNVIARYNVNGSQVYSCFLDASKAFDRVNHSILFDKLLQRNLSPVITRALLTWYTDQRVNVSWNNCSSDKFSVSNGVRQEGVLSPILFILMIYVSWRRMVLVATGVIILWVLFAMRMISPSLHLPLLHCVSCLTPALILLPLTA